MDYNHIKDYLGKFREIIFSKEENYRIISRIIEKYIQIPINTKSIKIKGVDIYIKATPLVKNEILIHKKQILEDLSLVIPNQKFKDIK